MSESFEGQLRQALDKSGLLVRMKSLFMEAALDVVNKELDPSHIDSRLLKPSEALQDVKETQTFGMSMALIVDFLRQYNLLHTLNVLKTECGSDVFPADAPEESEEEIQEEREALCEDLQISTEGSALERLFEKAKKTSPIQAQQQQQQSTTTPIGATTNVANNIIPPINIPTTSVSATSPVKEEQIDSNKASPVKQQQLQQSPQKEKSPEKGGKSKNIPEDATSFPLEKVSGHPKKCDETPYTVEYFDGGEFIRYNQIAGQPFQVDTCKNCRFIVLDAVDSVTLDDCENCEIIVAACENSFFLRTCKNVKLIVACKQLRTRDCVDCDIHLFTPTDPVVESSKNMQFYPFNLQSPNLVECFKTARFDAKTNRFIHVYDFTEDTKSPNTQNFNVNWPDHRNTKMVTYGQGVSAETGVPLNSPPEIAMLLRGEIDPATSLEKGAGKSLNIKTGANLWKEQQQQQGNDNNSASANANNSRPATAPSSGTGGATTTTSTSSASTSATSSSTSDVRPSTATASNKPSSTSSSGEKPASSSPPGKKSQQPSSSSTTATGTLAAKDPYMLGRDDSSSSSSSSFSSYHEDYEDEEDDDQF